MDLGFKVAFLLSFSFTSVFAFVVSPNCFLPEIQNFLWNEVGIIYQNKCVWISKSLETNMFGIPGYFLCVSIRVCFCFMMVLLAFFIRDLIHIQGILPLFGDHFQGTP